MSKLNYWDPVYEDSMNLIAKLPGIAALIYRNTYKGGAPHPARHEPRLGRQPVPPDGCGTASPAA